VSKSASDRFVIALMEQLFCLYLNQVSEVLFTYDSINYNASAMYGTKILVTCWSFSEDSIESYETIFNQCQKKLSVGIYYTDELYPHYFKELDRIKRGEPLTNSDMFSPLNIYSNMQLDSYFTYIIKRYSLAEIIHRSKSIFDVYQPLNGMLKELKVLQPKIFTNNLVKQIRESVEVLYKFHQWYCKRRDYGSLDELIELFIRDDQLPNEITIISCLSLKK
jgi:hypothetical protein